MLSLLCRNYLECRMHVVTVKSFTAPRRRGSGPPPVRPGDDARRPSAPPSVPGSLRRNLPRPDPQHGRRPARRQPGAGDARRPSQPGQDVDGRARRRGGRPRGRARVLVHRQRAGRREGLDCDGRRGWARSGAVRFSTKRDAFILRSDDCMRDDSTTNRCIRLANEGSTVHIWETDAERYTI